MDPVGIAKSIFNIGLLVAAKLKDMKDLGKDSLELSELVKRVSRLVNEAGEDLDEGQLRKPSAVAALQSLEATMAECSTLVDELADSSKRSKIKKFFRSADHLARVRTLTTQMARNLQAFQLGVNMEQHSELKERMTSLSKALNSVPLEVMRGFERQSAELRGEFDRLREDMRASGKENAEAMAENLMAAMLPKLREMGFVSSAKGVSRQEADEISSALRDEMESLRRDKRKMDEEYFAQIMSALSLAEGGGGKGAGAAASAAARAPKPAAPSIPPDYKCPITLCIMRDPVILVESGHSFEREAIEQHLRTSAINPYTQQRLSSKMVVPNIALRNAIEAWLGKYRLTHEQADEGAAGPSGSGSTQQASARRLDEEAERRRLEEAERRRQEEAERKAAEAKEKARREKEAVRRELEARKLEEEELRRSKAQLQQQLAALQAQTAARQPRPQAAVPASGKPLVNSAELWQHVVASVWKCNSAQRFYACNLVALELNSSGPASLKLYIDARGESDLRDPDDSTLAAVSVARGSPGDMEVTWSAVHAVEAPSSVQLAKRKAGHIKGCLEWTGMAAANLIRGLAMPRGGLVFTYGGRPSESADYTTTIVWGPLAPGTNFGQDLAAKGQKRPAGSLFVELQTETEKQEWKRWEDLPPQVAARGRDWWV